ncbi:DUF2461 domain-containing protein [uncultured Kriegella sp.]|uniref:DUF2461 domain-containing protein n=1 Tax=uncultured Kriegella sp. TaxID=1798910 RepID=UPI0030D9D814|tara:strand:- start:193116 stop:193778 length:663 start_codon:yes stop_codon:yes gene_type:complete
MITSAYTSFFKELSNHNNKEWFYANKKWYEQDVKKPFLNLLNGLIPQLMEWDDRILSDPKKAVFRINKDIRFSKDKSPYHLIMKAGFSPQGKKSIYPGYYLGIDSDKVHVGGGLFMLQPQHLKIVREKIAKDTDAFLKIISSKDFKTAFSALKGEKSKRLDKGLLDSAEKTALMYNKQFYAMAEFPLQDHYSSDNLSQFILGYFEKIRPLNSYLNTALIT